MGRRRKGAPPSYRLHKPSGQAVVTIAGKDHYLGPHGSADSRARYAELIGPYQGDAAGSEAASVGSVRDMVEHWRDWARVRYTVPQTLRNYESAVARLLAHCADLPARRFDRACLLSLRSKMIDSGLSRKTVNQEISKVKSVFFWALGDDRNLIPECVVQSIRLVRSLRPGKTLARETEPIKPVDPEVVEATLRRLKGHVVVLARVHLLTGARPGELCRLDWEMIDRTGPVWVADLAKHKTKHHGKRRTLLFGTRSQALLISILRESGPVFTTRNGARLTAKRYGKAINYAANAAGVEHWHPNQIRHTHATMIRRKYGIEAAQVALGHSSLKTTEIYAERDLSLAEKIAREIG